MYVCRSLYNVYSGVSDNHQSDRSISSTLPRASYILGSLPPPPRPTALSQQNWSPCRPILAKSCQNWSPGPHWVPELDDQSGGLKFLLKHKSHKGVLKPYLSAHCKHLLYNKFVVAVAESNYASYGSNCFGKLMLRNPVCYPYAHFTL